MSVIEKSIEEQIMNDKKANLLLSNYSFQKNNDSQIAEKSDKDLKSNFNDLTN